MAEALTSLPAVASKIYLDCKKCAAERYHLVLAHTSATSAKTQCEICKSKKVFKLKSATAKPRQLTGAALARKTASEQGRVRAHSSEYEALLAKATGSARKYKLTESFAASAKLEHPKFGVGVVKTSYNDKIEVVFADQVRLLVHNRAQ